MNEVIFDYKGSKTIIQCNENEKMKDICNRFISKILVNKENIYFSYNGKAGNEFNEELTLSEMINSIDKERKKMNVLVYDINIINKRNENNDFIIKSNYIICPECGENSKIKFKDYKISYFDCKNGHKKDNLSLDDFIQTQNIDLSQIICDQDQCNNNQYNSYNKQFYKCYTCNKKLCPLCKSKHDKKHIIINYDEVNFKCGKHNDVYIKYCNKCKINLCLSCEDDHLNHDILYLGDFKQNKNSLNMKLDELKQQINLLNDTINEIINILNKVKDYYNNYFNIANDMINNYNFNNRNYEILLNLKEIDANNKIIIDDIKEIMNKLDIKDIFNNILNIYKKVKENEIKLTLKIEEKDINKKIYFLDNVNREVYVNDKK